MNVFGVGPGEALLVLVIGLMVVGPGRFPEIAREAGRWYRLARRYSTEVMSDVRAAVDELEGEVTAPGEDLRSIREIGTEFRNELREAGRSVSEIGRETRAVAEHETSRALAAGNAPAPTSATANASATVTDMPATTVAVEDAEATHEASPAAAEAEAGEPAAPVSIRPSKRARPGAPVDPFETLAAKRARDADGGDSAQT
ncbi:MAG: twin-arginine translocase TatA/TatE family subunit [Chloroflexi bacterium]|nr:twin-arginine translocase TatA/TatE family subunit [Chloroflexota bacterium]MDA1001812.1 twin-arginine translocase TatA/TatE family subunit [Chloroflexota bacterium]MQC27619.1 hypothetical protein [Chloroflexota bacterium]